MLNTTIFFVLKKAKHSYLTLSGTLQTLCHWQHGETFDTIRRGFQFHENITCELFRYLQKSENFSTKLCKKFKEITESCVVKRNKNNKDYLQSRDHHSPWLTAIVLTDSGFSESTISLESKTLDLLLQLHYMIQIDSPWKSVLLIGRGNNRSSVWTDPRLDRNSRAPIDIPLVTLIYDTNSSTYDTNS